MEYLTALLLGNIIMPNTSLTRTSNKCQSLADDNYRRMGRELWGIAPPPPKKKGSPKY